MSERIQPAFFLLHMGACLLFLAAYVVWAVVVEAWKEFGAAEVGSSALPHHLASGRWLERP